MMSLLVVRPGVPVRANDKVGVAVAVEIPGGTALSPKMRGDLLLGPSVRVVVFRLAKRSDQGQTNEDGKRMAHAASLAPWPIAVKRHITLAALGQVR